MIWRAAILAATLALPATAQDMAGITLDAPLPMHLGAPVGMQTQGALAYRLWQPGAPLLMSVTTQADTDRVLYIEIWRDGAQGTAPAPLPDMTFGGTTLADIRARFGSDGVVFGERGRVATAGDNAAFFTSYEIADTDGVISFVTIMPLAGASQETAGQSVLDSVILGYSPYLDTLWGLNRGVSDGYQPVPDPLP